jgi:anti-sigma factor RsiW
MFDFLSRWRRSEHQACQDDLSAFVDGRLSARARSRVQRHLQECRACREDLESLRHTVALLRSAPVLKPPRSFLVPAAEGVRQRQARRRRLSYGFLQAATAVATVMLVLVVSGDALLRLQPPVPAAPLPTSGEMTAAYESREVLAAAPSAPTAVPSEPVKSVGVTAQPVAAPTEQAPAESVEAGQAAETVTADALQDQPTTEPLALPSRTFARPAAPPSPPTTEAAELAAPSESATVMVTDVATATPAPTPTAQPPTVVPVPTHTAVPPTNTPLPPTATPLPLPAIGEAEPPASRPPREGLFAFLEAVRPFLPWAEMVLASLVAVLLLATWWLGRRLRAV